MLAFSVRLVRDRSHETAQITTPAHAARLCCELLDGYDREVFIAIALWAFFYHAYRLVTESREREEAIKESRSGLEQLLYACAILYATSSFSSDG